MASATDVARNILGQGLLLGWGDELEGLVRSKFGDETYEDAVKQIRAENETYSTENPYGALAGEIAGGFIPTIGALALTPFTGGSSTALAAGNIGRLATMGARKLGPLGTAALVGAGEGAIAGAGTAEEGSRLQGAGLGAVIGGAAGTVVQKGSEAVVNALNKRAIQKAARQVPDESAYDPLQDRLVASGVRMDAVKDKGGNWIENEELFTDLYRGPPDASQLNEPIYKAERSIIKKLQKYAKSEMGTPEDPVRIQADAENILHFDGAERFGLPDPLANYSSPRYDSNTKFKRYGESREGLTWEDVSDREIRIETAGELLDPKRYADLRRDKLADEFFFEDIDRVDGKLPDEVVNKKVEETLEKYPWLSKVPPETKVFSPQSNANRYTSRNLRFDHLMDEMRNAMDPDSNLPVDLRINAEKVEQMSVPAMIRKVHKINEWRAKEAARVQKEGMMRTLQNKSVFQDDYFEIDFVDQKGGKWVELPSSKSEDGQICTFIGAAGGWCTQSPNTAAYYAPENRMSKLDVLLDAEGRPHVQVFLKDNRAFDPEEIGTEEDLYRDLEEYMEDWYGTNGTADDEAANLAQQDFIEDWTSVNEYKIELANDPAGRFQQEFSIDEIKPVGNSLGSKQSVQYNERDPDYAEKIANSTMAYLNNLSKKFGDNLTDVTSGDLDHLGIVDTNNLTQMSETLLDGPTGKAPRAVFEEFDDWARENGGYGDGRFIKTFELIRMFGSWQDRNFAEGGSVDIDALIADVLGD
mgnify:CR=1 FL=1|tara:strand:- start:3648 stop:5912 length:2265 start_codon:yes stop_codon:yes gene_type:complete